jgi:hypothetical protein
MEILKRIVLAIVVLPVSFVVIWFLTAFLCAFFTCVAETAHLDFSELFHDPTNFVQKAQGAWQDAEAQYAKDPAAYTQTWSDAAQLSLKKHFDLEQLYQTRHPDGVQTIATIYATLGAIIFFLSCLAYQLYLSLLTSRRIITVPLVFSYLFLIPFPILYLIVIYICIAIVRTASAPGQQLTNVTQFHANYDIEVIAGVALVVFIFAGYFSYRLTGWDGLPWCKNPLPVQPQSRAKRKP